MKKFCKKQMTEKQIKTKEEKKRSAVVIWILNSKE